MKKFIALITALSTLFLSACVQKDLINIYVFSERFSSYCENFKIDTDNLVAEEKNNTLGFPLVFNDKILLTININSETSLITDFSVTYMFDKTRKLSDEDLASFIEIASGAAKAFTNYKNTDEIFSELSIRTKSDVLKDNHISFEKEFYKFSFVSNELGFYFTASTYRR